jgi:phenylalanyl-tRNA synthetase beta chain
MKISYNWLKDYLNFELSPEKLSKLLTDSGLEVEGLEKWQSVKGGMEGIVIGEVVTCEKHPNADKLSVTTVDIGDGTLLPIVCGAPNVAAGQKVVVATVGTKLYEGDNYFEIKKAKLRGEVSEGMICAEDEIGLGTSHDGIMVLDEKAKPGTTAAGFFNITEDYIFEIGLTPNRTDAMSHIGTDRDIKAVLDNIDFLNKIQSEREINPPSIDKFKVDNHDLDIEVIVENSEACPRYTGVTISGIEVKESPDWLKNRLNAIGLKPINNIVDITNYVLHETGQPLHAFDADKITGNKVVVKKLSKGTKFTTLDEEERELTGNDLMICNTKEGMCIGGVFGGLKSGVTGQTTNIFLESAWFDPVHIRKTSKHHDLNTDASFRFERGIDPEMVIYALKRASLLIQELAGGVISSEIKDVYSKPFENTNVGVYWKNIDRLIGKNLGNDVIKNILISLEFKILEETEEGMKLSVPSYRIDVTREADVIEEILRIYGYDNIEIPAHQNSAISHRKKPDSEKVKNTIAAFLSDNSFREIMNNSLTKADYYEKCNDFDENRNVKILNPLSRDLNVMRQSLLFGGLEVISYNLNRRITDQKLFEFGKTYFKNPGTDEGRQVTEKYDEINNLAIFVTGKKDNESWYTPVKEVDFTFLKAMSQNLLRRIGIPFYKFEYLTSKKEYFDYGLEVSYNKKQVFEIGKISSKLLKNFDIKQSVLFAAFNWDYVFELVKKVKIEYVGIPKYPEVRRDLALLLDKKIPFADVEKLAYETERKLLKSVNLFDVYEGENIVKDKKSYAVSFILQDKDKTLTDKVIDKVMKKMMRVFEEKLNASIR